MTKGTALTHPATGEILDLAQAGTEQLAIVAVRSEELRGELVELESRLSDELVARLDRGAEWTQRFGDPKGDRQFEISAPSPTAGTEAYDATLLLDELRALVDRQTIDASAADTALVRTVTVVFQVPLAGNPKKVADTALAIDSVGDEPVVAQSASVAPKVSLGGIAKLRKVPGTGAALDRAKIPVNPPARRAKIKVKMKAAA